MLLDLENKNSRIYLVLLIVLGVAMISLIPRIDGTYFNGKYLWAEDGNIFINQAQSLGLSAIWTPYAGYLHAYPRLIAHIGSFFDLTIQPYIFLSGWVLSFAFLVAVITVRAVNLGLSVFHTCLLVALVALQPATSEMFFNVTNSQWMLAAALTLYILANADSNRVLSSSEYVLLAVLCLTGPISIFLLPLLILQGLANKNIKQNIWLYLTVSLCAFVQVMVVLGSGRIKAPALSPDLEALFYTSWSLVSFSAFTPAAIVSASLFWVAFACVMFYLLKDNSIEAIARMRVSLLLLGASILYILVSLYAQKENFWILFNKDGGNRYTWIPYTLIFFSAFIASNEFKKMQTLIILSISTICLLHFHPVSLQNLQYQSYVNFSNYHPVVIPINPSWKKFPGWHIKVVDSKRNTDSIMYNYEIEYDTILESGRSNDLRDSASGDFSGTDRSAFFFKKPVSCTGASDIGVEIEMIRSKEGWTQLFWDPLKNFTDQNSVKRFYPAGEIKAQFAFPNAHHAFNLRLDLLGQYNQVQLKQMMIYCLP
jgi:hypothetical protein